MQLMGELSGHIWQFTELQMLDLSCNKELVGSLPPEVQNLKKLRLYPRVKICTKIHLLIIPFLIAQL
ncbi:putative leucine-rich repeat domain superfamily [Helianthus debilis subsp. tardiflorus]